MKRFALIGASGFIAPRHLRAIKSTGHQLVAALDKNDSVGILDSYFPDAHFFTEFERFDRHLEKLRREKNQKVDYVSICSPNYLHDAHIRFALRIAADAVCEKPLALNPWNIDALQQLVEERTDELRAANKELEAFAYTVSHDLRAPLRAIDGFTRILLEDYAAKLDDEAKRIGTVISQNTQKMGMLIDDLLQFSRMGRTEMRFSSIDKKNMAFSIFHELTSKKERDRIDFQVDDIPRIVGDTNLMRNVWMNRI